MLGLLTSRFQSFLYGIKLPLEAFRLILKKKSLLSLAIIPILLTGALYYYLIGGMVDWAQVTIKEYILSWGWDPEGWAAWGLNLVTQITLLIVAALTFAFSSSIVASPFNDFLAERTERFSTPKLPKVENQSISSQIRLIWIDLMKAMAATGVAIFAILFSWVPILNLFAFMLSFLLVSFQYISYPQTRRGVGLRQGARFLWKHLYATCGFGLVITGLYTVPFLSSLVLPVAVVGGTLLVARAQSPHHSPLK